MAGLGSAFWFKVHTDAPEKISTSIAAPKPSPAREVVSTTIDSSGYLIITYSDGSVSNVGKVKGENGANGEGRYPTDEQLDDALARYCTDGRCDPRSPTQAEVLQAVASYCRGGTCRGASGADAPAPTAEQLADAVAAYCANGRCKGETGATGPTGATGAAGKTTQMNCVLRTVNNLTTKYVAWKYTDEPNTAYRDLYKIPSWSECSNSR